MHVLQCLEIIKNKTPGMCCTGGKVKLPELHCTEPLSTLVSGGTSQSKHFMANIRKYNYMPTLKVQRQIYHRTRSLLPLPNADHKFLEIYFIGNTNEQINQCFRLNTGI